MANENLGAARKAQKDEFYTQYHDIDKEMNAYLDFDENVFRDKTILLPCDDPEWSNFTKYFAQNFERLGLKKLISTSYAPDSKPKELDLQLTLFETQSPKFDKSKARANGKIYTLTRDTTGDQRVNVEDLEWAYLKGDGDFRGAEVTALRDEADIIITNPPFSLFREFLAWIVTSSKRMVIIGNMNAISYKEVFPLIKDQKIWFGPTITSGDREFQVPDTYPLEAAGWRVDEHGKKFIRMKGVRWYTNLDHGRRHQPLKLMSMEDNKRFSKHKEVKNFGYKEFDNYFAIEVPFTDSIPSDHLGAMGVPISFLDKYNPEQFEILDANDLRKPHQPAKNYALIKDADGSVEGVNKYVRIVIQHRRAS